MVHLNLKIAKSIDWKIVQIVQTCGMLSINSICDCKCDSLSSTLISRIKTSIMQMVQR